jgi:hypothetical protein
MVRRRAVLSLVFLLLPVLTTGQQNKERDVWAPWQFLMGRWTAKSNGKPGEGKGIFSFTLELQGKILGEEEQPRLSRYGRPCSFQPR